MSSSVGTPFPVPIGWATPTNEPSLQDPETTQGPRAAGSAWSDINIHALTATSDAELAMMMQLNELQTARSGDTPDIPVHTESRYFTDPVWGEVHFDSEPDKWDNICFACCPCWMIGCGGKNPPCCGKHQQPVLPQDAKRAWRRFLCSITLLVSVLQIIVLIVVIYLCDGFAPLDDNIMLGPKTDAFNLFGAKNAARVIEYGEWWRLMTPIMLHSGFLHLMSNLFVQLKVGIQLEVIWGHRLWISIYFFSGVFANLASCIFLPDKLGVGASGGICGLIGAEIVFLALTWRQTLPKDVVERNALFVSLIVTILLIILISAFPLMDFAAHCGGLLAGALIGLIVFSDRAQERSDRFRMGLQIAGFVLVGSLCIVSVNVLLQAVKPDSQLLHLCETLSEC